MTPGIFQIQQILNRAQYFPSKIFTSLGIAIAATDTFDYCHVGAALNDLFPLPHTSNQPVKLYLQPGVDVHL